MYYPCMIHKNSLVDEIAWDRPALIERSRCLDRNAAVLQILALRGWAPLGAGSVRVFRRGAMHPMLEKSPGFTHNFEFLIKNKAEVEIDIRNGLEVGLVICVTKLWFGGYPEQKLLNHVQLEGCWWMILCWRWFMITDLNLELNRISNLIKPFPNGWFIIVLTTFRAFFFWLISMVC